MTPARWILCGLLLVLWPAQASAQQMIASVWYRGLPAGVPRYVDLAAIRDGGFTAVTWPLEYAAGAMELQRMASRLGLTVVVRAESVPLTLATAREGAPRVDLHVATTPRAEWTTLAWRAVAHGARVVSFDPGGDAGAAPGVGGVVPEWWPVAVTLGRQLTGAASLISTLQRGPSVRVDPPDDMLDVSLLENPRSWVIIATNASSTTGRLIDTTAVFPPQVPAAEWLNIFDGSMMSMLYRPDGSRWRVRLGPGEARVFVIDKRSVTPR